MLHNYVLTFWRIMLRNKVYTALNIIGLAVGISSCVLITLYIKDELSYDRQFDKAGRIYKIASSITTQGQEQLVSSIPFGFAPTLAQLYPDVEATVRLMSMPKRTVWFEKKMLNIEGLFYSDPTFFDLFNYHFILGNPVTALREPNTIILTRELAEKFFGSAPAAMGKQIRTSKHTFEVTGVIENPQRTHLVFTGLASMATLGRENLAEREQGWAFYHTYTYVLLQEQAQQQEFQDVVAKFGDQVVAPILRNDNLNHTVRFFPQPLTGIHLDHHVPGDPTPPGNRTNLSIFGFVAVFVLLIACINYTNLATARSAKRAHEVGLRKAVGADRSQLIGQFLSESLLMTLFATVLALALVEFLLPTFNLLTGKQIAHAALLSPEMLLPLLAMVMLIALLAGGYPAFFLSGFNPMAVLRASNRPDSGNAILRKALVVTQFSISIALIICTLVVVSQMNYLKNSNLGFDKEQVLVIAIPAGDTTLIKKAGTIKGELLQNPQVKQAAISTFVPGDEIGTSLFHFQNKGNYEERSLNAIWVGEGFLELLNTQMVAGQPFTREQANNQNSIIINEAAARLLGWHGDPVGRKVKAGNTELAVVGMVKDFNYQSLHHRVEPLLLLPTAAWARYMTLRLAPEDVRSTLGFIERKWQSFDPDHPMEYYFLDEHFDKQYRAEESMLTIFGYFTLLTILIACMGLFGLAAFTAEQRTKEIGIRKVLGSSVSEIVVLLSKDFALLVLIAIVIACPVAWYGMEKWLQDFAYRTPISVWIFILSGLAALLIATLTVSYKATRAAMTDPVQALRIE